MAVYAIGDLQGCYDELQRLLEQLRFDPTVDRVWFTGDLVNRGRQSLLALRAVKALGPVASVVLGNHDLHLLAVAQDTRKKRAGDTLDDILSAPDRDELLDWLRHRPLLHDDPELGVTMVHAGVAPQWTPDRARDCARAVSRALRDDPDAFLNAMYGNQPNRWSETLAGDDRLRFSVNCLTRLRYVNAAGELLLKHKGPIATAPPEAIPWFRAPHRAPWNRRIVFGHWSTLGLYVDEYFVGLDTGCVWGQALTAFRLDREEPPVAVGCPGAVRFDPSRPPAAT
jgi:bis(5'-nucleosyl)-tetraphosphatase (symmetrical)